MSGLRFHVTGTDLNVSSTFFCEVWADMETWCRQNCVGKFELLRPNDARFENEDDMRRFAAKWMKSAEITEEVAA